MQAGLKEHPIRPETSSQDVKGIIIQKGKGLFGAELHHFLPNCLRLRLGLKEFNAQLAWEIINTRVFRQDFSICKTQLHQEFDETDKKITIPDGYVFRFHNFKMIRSSILRIIPEEQKSEAIETISRGLITAIHYLKSQNPKELEWRYIIEISIPELITFLLDQKPGFAKYFPGYQPTQEILQLRWLMNGMLGEITLSEFDAGLRRLFPYMHSIAQSAHSSCLGELGSLTRTAEDICKAITSSAIDNPFESKLPELTDKAVFKVHCIAEIVKA